MNARALKAILLGTVSTVILAAHSHPVLADDSDEEGEYIGEVSIADSRREVRTDTATSVTDIDQEEILDRQAATVAELIDTVPGVTLVNGTTPQSSGIAIRGFGADGTYGTSPRVLILIDGATTGGEEIYRIGNQLFTDPSLYRSVSVIRGTVGSFEFGSGVVGGVVQLETKDASDFTGGEVGTRFRQTLEAQSNGFGFATSSILAWQPTEDVEVLLNYTLRDNDSYDNGAGFNESSTNFRDYSYLLKGRYTFGDDKAHAVSAWYNVTHSDEKNVPYDILGASGGGGFYFGDVDRIVDSATAGFRYEYNPIGNDMIDFSATLTYADQQIDSTYIPGSCAGFPGCDFVVRDLLDADHSYKTTKLTLKNASFFQTGTASHDLRYGVEFIHRDRKDGVTAAPGGTDERWAVFAVDEIEIGGNLTLTPALRYEAQTVTGGDIIAPGEVDPFNGQWDNSALMGGLSARYEFNNGFAVFASAAYTEVFPIIDRLDKPPAMWVPEKAQTYEAGASYLRDDLFASGDRLALKATYYDTNVRDVRAVGNILTTVDVSGVELEASYANGTGFYVDFQGTIADGDQHFPGGSTTDWILAPEPSGAVTVGKRFGETLDLSWELIGARGADAINGSGRLGGYGVSNLRATFIPQQGAFEGVEIRFGVENVFDKLYQTQLSTRSSPGRNFKLSLAKTF